MDNECKRCFCPNCMAAIEAECYEMYDKEIAEKEAAKIQAQMAAVAYQSIQKSMQDLLDWSADHIDDEPSDAEIVNDFASYETTWKDKWKQLWS